MRVFALLFAALLMVGCSSEPQSAGEDALRTTIITVPGGKTIRAELAVTPVDMQRGMMFRESIASGRGMLFIHSKPDALKYWMYQVKIPLDIIFMDPSRRVLGISANTPPCTKNASGCPTYGGYPGAKYVLELGGGEAAKFGIVPGSVLEF